MNDGERAARTRETELLGVEDVAGLVGVKETTVYKWCKEGKLPCLKVGRRWRVRREAIDDFLKGSEHRVTLAGQLNTFLREPDSVLAVAQNIDLLHRIDVAFFLAGLARGGLLAKFYAGENKPKEEMLASFEQNGLEASRLEREGRLLMREEEDPLGEEREDAITRVLDQEGENGRTVWASFDWVRHVDLEMAFEQQRRLTELVDARHLVVKTATLEGAIEEWTPSDFRRAQYAHAAIILASESGLALSRATPMPPS